MCPERLIHGPFALDAASVSARRHHARHYRTGGPDADAPGVRGTTNPDRAFWSKPVDAEAGWMEGLSSDEPNTAETQALDDLAAGRNASTDRVFHELRDIAITPPPTADTADTGGDGGPDDPDDALPPAASTVDFDFNTVSDDLLPSWNLWLG